MDRTYFKSVYLRDPDGHILELATVGPGLTVDEPLEGSGADRWAPAARPGAQPPSLSPGWREALPAVGPG